MQTYKLKIKKTTEAEVNIKLPYFGKIEYGVFAITGPDSATEVLNFNKVGMGTTHLQSPEGVYQKKHTEITADEFRKEYDRIISAAYDRMESIFDDISSIQDAQDESRHEREMEQYEMQETNQ